MNHNPNEFQVGDMVMLDEKYNNASQVIITYMTTAKLYSTIRDPETGSEWTVMTNRLTPLKTTDTNG